MIEIHLRFTESRYCSGWNYTHVLRNNFPHTSQVFHILWAGLLIIQQQYENISLQSKGPIYLPSTVKDPSFLSAEFISYSSPHRVCRRRPALFSLSFGNWGFWNPKNCWYSGYLYGSMLQSPCPWISPFASSASIHETVPG